MKKVKDYLQAYKDLLIPPRVGDIIKGKVIEKTKNGVFLELGNYKIGLIKKEDLDVSGKSLSKIEKGEEILAKITNLNNKDDFVELSLGEANKDLIWKKLQDLSDEREQILLSVAGANKGGLIFNFHGIQGFLPASQLSREHYPKIENPTPERIFKELKKFVGQEIKVKIISIDSRREKLILSEKYKENI